MSQERITYVRYPDHVQVSVELQPLTTDSLHCPSLAREVIKDKTLLPCTPGERFIATDNGCTILHRARYDRMPEEDAIDFQHSTSQARLTMALTELVELKQRLGILATERMLPRNEFSQ